MHKVVNLKVYVPDDKNINFNLIAHAIQLGFESLTVPTEHGFIKLKVDTVDGEYTLVVTEHIKNQK